MTGPVISRSEDALASWQEYDYIPVLEKVSSADETELEQYRKKLRQYFLHEKKTTDSLQIDVAPVLLVPYLRGGNPEMSFPVLYDHESHEVTSLQHMLQEMFKEIFNPDEADALAQSLPHIASLIQEKLADQDADPNFDFQVKVAFKALRQLDEHHEETEVFHQQCDRFEAHLLTKKATLIGFSALTAFQILNLQLKERNVRNQTFLTNLKKCITGLNELLLLQGDDTGTAKDHFDFAGELISFDKITDMATPVVSSGLPEARLIRLQNCLQTLLKAEKSYSDNSSIILVAQDLAEEFGLKKTLNEATFEITSESSCTRAKTYYKKEIKEFVQIVAALRLADLEINQKYDENLHAPYFAGFDLSYLSDDDIQYFRSVIVVEDSRKLTLRPGDFLALLSDHAPVKVLAVNRLDEIGVTVNHKDDEETYLELAALAIFRRNAYVFQGAAHTPSWLNEAFHKGLVSPSPALWNILFTKPGPKLDNGGFFALKTAIESRYFPHLEYDIRSGEDFGSHFDISGNPQPELSFPLFDQEIKSPSGKQTHQYSLTMADCLAMRPDALDILYILPSGYRNEDLVLLVEYLNVPQDSLPGKIPFIWMVDEQNILRQAVIPISWLQRCRARLDYWRFLQEMGGVNSFHVQHAIVEARSQWEAEKKSDIEDIKAQLQAGFDLTRSEDLAKAISRMLNALLDTDKEITTLLTQPSNAIITSQEEDKIASEPRPVEKGEDVKPTVSSEAWVEGDECTSCNDCIEALPAVFKYNSDKQAFVHNPKGGTYAKIVATAEKCPAACIHPGLPHNTDEPGLEKLILRAAKFN